MHELSIALRILDIAGEEAARREARILAVHLQLGALSGVVAEALTSAFGLARENTQLDGCELVVEVMPLVIHCPRCRAARPAKSAHELACQECGAPSNEIVSGRELDIVALEIEQ